MSLVSVGARGEDGEKKTDSDEARAVLKKCAEAIKKLDRVAYRAEYLGTEWVANFVPEIEGKVVVGKRSKYDIVEFFCHADVRPRGSEESFEYTAGCDGDSYFLIDPKTKMAHKDIDPAVLGSQGRNLQRPVFEAFADEEPFKEELGAENIGLGEGETIDGHECHEIVIEGSEPPKVTLFISMRDHLPRRVLRTYENPEGEPGSTRLTLTSVVADPAEPKDPFKVQVPEGYTLTDEFAP